MIKNHKELLDEISKNPHHVSFIMSAIIDKVNWTESNRRHILKNDEEFKINGDIPDFISGSNWVLASDEIKIIVNKFLNPFSYEHRRTKRKHT